MLSDKNLIHVFLTCQDEVEKFRKAADVTVEGHNVPKPITSFARANFPSYVTEVLLAEKFEKPTAIQAQGIFFDFSGFKGASF